MLRERCWRRKVYGTTTALEECLLQCGDFLTKSKILGFASAKLRAEVVEESITFSDVAFKCRDIL